MNPNNYTFLWITKWSQWIPNGLNVGESCGSCLAFPFLIVSIVFIFWTSCLQVNHIQFNVCKVLWTNTFFSWLCGLQLFRIDTYYLIIEKISQNQCVFKTRTHIDIVIFKTLKHFTPYWRRKYSEYEKPYFRSSPRRCSVKKVFLKISQISQKETCGRVSFLIKLHEISKNIFSYKTLPGYSLWHFYHKQLFLSNSYKYLTINFNFVLS